MSGNQDESQKSDNNIQQMSSQWAEIIGQLFDRLTGKGASVTYTFDNLVIDMPKAHGPSGQELGSARWTVNGRLVITAETHRLDQEEGMQRLTSTSSGA
jgi:hypothetical protein